MRIAVISDTHLERPSAWFEKVFAVHLESAAAVIHCGDLTGIPLLHFLSHHDNLHAVAGNMDAYGPGPDLPSALDLTLEGFRIGVSHGWGGKTGVGERVAEAFGPGFDLICYGHTHRPALTRAGRTLLLNPGAMEAAYGDPSLAMIRLTPGQDIEVSFGRIDSTSAKLTPFSPKAE